MDVATRLPRRARGLTVIELIVTLAVAAILGAIALPAWSVVAERARITATANGLLGQLHYARNEAVTRHANVTLCPSADGVVCSGEPTGWHAGYLVFVDADNSRTREAGEQILRRTDPVGPGIRLHTTAGRPAIRFMPDGAAWGTNATFSVCADGASRQNRAVILLGTGRARVDDVRPDGSAVSCD
jgi:type IV fimbrial biogenesis protein FimT